MYGCIEFRRSKTYKITITTNVKKNRFPKKKTKNSTLQYEYYHTYFADFWIFCTSWIVLAHEPKASVLTPTSAKNHKICKICMLYECCIRFYPFSVERIFKIFRFCNENSHYTSPAFFPLHMFPSRYGKNFFGDIFIL